VIGWAETEGEGGEDIILRDGGSQIQAMDKGSGKRVEEGHKKEAIKKTQISAWEVASTHTRREGERNRSRGENRDCVVDRTGRLKEAQVCKGG